MAYNPSLPPGQATMANSAPVVIASDQSAIGVTGPITVNQGTNPWIVTGLGGTFIISGIAGITGLVGVTGIIAATQSGTWNVGVTNVIAGITGTVAVTQSTSPWVVGLTNSLVGITGTPTVNQGTNPWVVGLTNSLVGITGPVSVTTSGTQDVNLKQVGGIATDIGLGAAASGTQRVAISSDSTISATVSTTTLQNQNLIIIDLLSELLVEMRATRLAMAAWTSEAVAGYNIGDFEPHNIQKQII